jgi:hypothetical protein
MHMLCKVTKWKKAMDAEIAAIERNNIWELPEVSATGKVIGVKWIYKTKLKEKGEVDKYKARLVAKGYSQQYGIDLYRSVCTCGSFGYNSYHSFNCSSAWLNCFSA